MGTTLIYLRVNKGPQKIPQGIQSGKAAQKETGWTQTPDPQLPKEKAVLAFFLLPAKTFLSRESGSHQKNNSKRVPPKAFHAFFLWLKQLGPGTPRSPSSIEYQKSLAPLTKKLI